jgi:alpha-1,6-mannosyltransferase
VAHIVGPILAVAICVQVVRRLPVLGLPRTLGLSLSALVLLGPIVQPWYLLWGLVILATTAGSRTARAIAALSVTVCLLGVVGLGQLAGEWSSLTPLLRILLALLVAAAATVPIPSGLTGPRKTRRISSILRRRTRPELHLRHA